MKNSYITHTYIPDGKVGLLWHPYEYQYHSLRNSDLGTHTAILCGELGLLWNRNFRNPGLRYAYLYLMWGCRRPFFTSLPSTNFRQIIIDVPELSLVIVEK
jgi:hypothetical protein